MFGLAKRLFQSLGICIAFSAFIGVFVFFGILADTTEQCGNAVALASVIFFGLNIFFLEQSYFSFEGLKPYFAVNLAVQAVFLIANAIAYFWGNEELYGFLFGITRVFSIWVARESGGISLAFSVALFHFLMIAIILLTPVFCRIFIETEEETDNMRTEKRHRLYMPLLGMRVAELCFSEIAVSVVMAGICELFAVEGVKPEALLMFVGFILIAGYNVRCFYSYMDFARSLRVYFRVNIAALLIFTAISLLVSFLDFDIIMKIFFFPYRMFTLAGKSNQLSVLATSGIMLALLLATPFVFPPKDDRR